ncbi:MAG: tetraacyldisaccharide 4'-kinase, partial [Steroidobacteraceae bacterium]
MQDWLFSIWYGGPARGRWLQPLAWLYGGILRLRRALHARDGYHRYRSRRPVVVVGNLSVGGTGKTPFVLWLAQQLAGRGLQVGIASRGYGGAGGPARRLATDEDAARVGDEPLLLQRRLGCPVAVGARVGRRTARSGRLAQPRQTLGLEAAPPEQHPHERDAD